MILNCQGSDVNECSVGHKCGQNRSAKPETCFQKLKFWSKTTPRFLADADGFASMPMRVTGKQDSHFFCCCSCRSCLHLVSICYSASSLDRISKCLVGLLGHLRWMMYSIDCHQHIDDAVWNGLEVIPCWKEWCTLWKAVVQAQSLGGHQREAKLQVKGHFPAWFVDSCPSSMKITSSAHDQTWQTSSVICINVWCGQWYQKLPTKWEPWLCPCPLQSN